MNCFGFGFVKSHSMNFSAWICTVLCRIVVSAVDMTSFRQKTVRFQIVVFRLESYSFLPNLSQELAGARKNSAKSCRIPGKTLVSGIVQFFAESGKSGTISGVIFGKKLYKSRQRCYIWKPTVFCRKYKLI